MTYKVLTNNIDRCLLTMAYSIGIIEWEWCGKFGRHRQGSSQLRPSPDRVLWAVHEADGRRCDVLTERPMADISRYMMLEAVAQIDKKEIDPILSITTKAA
jgi:hypothetical protein